MLMLLLAVLDRQPEDRAKCMRYLMPRADQGYACLPDRLQTVPSGNRADSLRNNSVLGMQQ